MQGWRVKGACLVMGACLAGVLWLPGCQDKVPDPMTSGAQKGQKAGHQPYEKPEGVTFHISAILGMHYTQFQGSEMEAYLGVAVDEERLPGIRGRVIRYGQGRIYVGRDTIYAVAYEFPRPVSRLEALHQTGLPESVGAEFKPYSTSERIERSSYGMRRVVLTRVAPSKEQFTMIEAWKFLPIERF